MLCSQITWAMSPVGLCFPRRVRAAVPGGMLKLSCPPQVAVLLPRAAELRQPPPLRDHSRLRAQPPQVHLHRHPPAAAGEIPGGEGQAGAGEADAHPHPLPQVGARGGGAVGEVVPSSPGLWASCSCLMRGSSPDSFPCWRRRFTVRIRPSGRRISPCPPPRVPSWCRAQVPRGAAPWGLEGVKEWGRETAGMLPGVDEALPVHRGCPMGGVCPSSSCRQHRGRAHHATLQQEAQYQQLCCQHGHRHARTHAR